ncbi:MAG: hypothetical protein JST42_27355 [Bacteroidetes bacterium]|nr:hypothetical protein [Bacteroidota bacterium]
MKSLFSFSMAILAIGTIATSCGSSRSAQKADPASGAWQQQPLTIDGSDKDWTKPLPYSVKSDQLSYAVTNDNQNLYILMTTSSPQEQQKIIQGGMTVWVNTKGEKSYAGAVGIGYPLDPHTDRDKNLMEEAQPQRKNNKPVTLEDKHDYQLYGFDNGQIPTFTYGDTNTQGIVMRMDYNDAGALVYEASVPLQTLYPGHNPSSSYASKTVAVGFLIEGLLPGTDVPRGGGGGGPTIGVGGGVGFGSFGSGGGLGISIGTGSLIGGGGGGRKQLFRQSEVWQTVQLSGSAGQPLRGF